MVHSPGDLSVSYCTPGYHVTKDHEMWLKLHPLQFPLSDHNVKWSKTRQQILNGPAGDAGFLNQRAVVWAHIILSHVLKFTTQNKHTLQRSADEWSVYPHTLPVSYPPPPPPSQRRGRGLLWLTAESEGMQSDCFQHTETHTHRLTRGRQGQVQQVCVCDDIWFFCIDFESSSVVQIDQLMTHNVM